MRKARTIALAIAVAVPVGLLALLYVYPHYMAAGPRLRRECVSLVDTVLNEDREDRTVPTAAELTNELEKRGVTLPTYPAEPYLTPGDSPSEWRELKQKAHEAAGRAYDDKWEKLRQDPAYAQAWETVFNQKRERFNQNRERAIKDCILNRARREGVRQQ